MGLYFNGTNIPNGATLRYNGTDIENLYYNGTLVWQADPTISVIEDSVILRPDLLSSADVAAYDTGTLDDGDWSNLNVIFYQGLVTTGFDYVEAEFYFRESGYWNTAGQGTANVGVYSDWSNTKAYVYGSSEKVIDRFLSNSGTTFTVNLPTYSYLRFVHHDRCGSEVYKCSAAVQLKSLRLKKA